jgi:hypothetical protein
MDFSLLSKLLRGCLMKMLIFIMGICLFFAHGALDLNHAQEIVQAEGIAGIHKDFVDIARDRALSDAQRQAVEQAVGVMIENETLVENYQVISDKILSRSKGYIQSYQIISEGREKDIYKVLIEAKVSIGQLQDDLQAIRLIIARKSKPRMMILASGKEQKDFIAEAEMGKYFLSKGFKLVDSTAVRKKVGYRSLKGLAADPKAAARVGNQFGAEVVVLCSIDTGSSPFKIGDVAMHSNRATISAKVINVDTKEIIATESETKRIPGMEGDIQPATEKASEMLANVLMNKILAQWSSEVTNTFEVTLSASGLSSYDELNSLKSLLTHEVRGVKDIRQRYYAKGRAELEIELEGNTQDLANGLARLKVPGKRIEISEITQNSVRIRLAP